MWRQAGLPPLLPSLAIGTHSAPAASSAATAREVVEVHGGKVPEAPQVVAVPVEPQELYLPHPQPGLLAQLAPGGGLDVLVGVDEPSGNVEEAALGRVSAPQHQH